MRFHDGIALFGLAIAVGTGGAGAVASASSGHAAPANVTSSAQFSISSISATPAQSVPDPPTNLTVAMTGGAATLHWTAGATNGYPITGYVVNSQVDGVASTNVCPISEADISTSCVVSNLVNGGTYTFFVQAISAAGISAYSGASNQVVVDFPPLGLSQLPLIVTSLTGPALAGTHSSSLTLTTSGGDVSGLDIYGVGGQGFMSVINSATDSVTGDINVGVFVNSPSAMAINPAGTFVYVVYQQTNNVEVVDTSTQQVIDTIAVGKSPSSIAINPGGTLAYVTNYDSSTVSVINLLTNTVSAVIPVGGNPSKVLVNNAGTIAVVQCASEVAVIDTATSNVTEVSEQGVATGIALNPAGTTAYSLAGLWQVQVIDLATATITATIVLGPGNVPNAITVNRAGTLAYAINNYNGTISVIDLSNDSVRAVMPIQKSGSFGNPGTVNMFIDPSGHYGFLSDGQVVNLDTNAVVTTIAEFAGDIQFNSAGTIAYSTGGGQIDYFPLSALTDAPANSAPFGFIISAASPTFMVISTPATTYAVVDGTAKGCTVLGTVLSATSAGTCIVTATMAGDHTYSPVSSVATAVNFPLTRIVQSPLTVTTRTGTVDAATKLASAGGSGTGAVRYRVRNGSAGDCTIRGSSLSSKSPGACVVTATKAGDSTYFAVTSTATVVTMKLPAKPATLSLFFSAGGTALSPSVKRTLTSLAKKLVGGATVVVAGHANGNTALAKIRARRVANFLKSVVSIRVVVRTVLSPSSNNTVTVTTLKQ